MSKSIVVCENPKCGKEFEKENKEINRSKRLGRKQYCCRSCYGNHEGKLAFNHISEEVKKRNQDNIKKYCGNARDEKTPFRYFMKVSKNGNRKKEVNVDLEYLMGLWKSQGGICPITGWKLDLPLGTQGWEGEDYTRRASLDRIDTKKGYVKGNVRFISWTANLALARINDGALIEFCKAVVKNNKCS
jgi:hypothetical protein